MKKKILKYLNKMFFACILAPVDMVYRFYLQGKYLKYAIKKTFGFFRSKVVIGNTPLRNKHCVFVSYSPRGILQSTFTQIEWINRLGYSVTIVSNCNISEEDLLQLIKMSYKVIIRENAGGDFGAYQRGIMDFFTLPHKGISHLMIMNDSILFPLSDPTNKFREMENSAYDFWGLTEHEVNGLGQYHLGSFCIVFSKKCFSSNTFKKFWQKYQPSFSRKTTIHKGEKKLSSSLIKAGFVPGCVYSSTKLMKYLDSISLKEIVELIGKSFSYELLIIIERIKSLYYDRNHPLYKDPHFDKIVKSEIITFLLIRFTIANPNVNMCFFMRQSLDCTFLKKDIVQKRSFPLGFVLCRVQSEIIDDSQIELIYRKKGFYGNLSLWKKILMQLNYI